MMNRADLKVVLLGHEAVGKTSLMERFVYDRFKYSYQNTIGSAFSSKEVQVDNKKLTLGVWDTAGSERYEAMTKIYYRGAAAAIICYDVRNPETFNRAKYWMRELRSVEEDCVIYLCATKKDLLDSLDEANPPLETVKKYAEGVQANFYLTSSKTGDSVAEVFNAIAEDFVNNAKNAKRLGDFITLVDTKKQSRCCFA